MTDDLEMYSDPKCSVKVTDESPKKWICQKDGYAILELWVRNEGKHDFFVQDLIFSDQAETSISTDVIYPNRVAKVTIRVLLPISIVELIPEHWFTIHGYYKIPPKIETKASGGSGIATFENGEPIESPTYELDTPEKLHERAKKALEKMRLENAKKDS